MGLMDYSPIDQKTKSWDKCSAFPEALVAASDDHEAAHARLFELTRAMPSDFQPYGQRVRGGRDINDCSSGCRHYAVLAGPLGHDWGVCMNKRSPRAGLLTFEHQGCPEFERGSERR